MKNRVMSFLLAIIMAVSLLTVPASAASSIGAKATGSVNMRKGAGTSYSKIMTIPKNAEVIILGTSGKWYKVIYKDTAGYASKSYLTKKSVVSGDFGTGTVTGSGVRFRSGAGTSYSVSGSFSKGDKVTVKGADGGWYKISFNGKNGYISADYLTVSAPEAKAKVYTGVISAEDVRMRTGPGTSYDILKTYSRGTEMEVSGSDDGWYAVKYNGAEGYVIGTYMTLTPTTAYSTAKTGTVTGNVNLRMGPSSSLFSTVTKLKKGENVKITGISGSFYEVMAGSEYGYVSKSYITLTTEPEYGIVTGNSVRLRSGAGTGYSILGYYNKGTEVKILSKSGNWYKITIGSVTGYMSADYISKKNEAPVSTGDTSLGERLVNKAKSYLGTPYVYGGASPSGFDCSGLIYYVYGQFDIVLSRGAGGQWLYNGNQIPESELMPGDLVFFSDDVDPIGHVGMYIGNRQYIHSSTSRGGVVIADLSGDYYDNYFYGAKRII